MPIVNHTIKLSDVPVVVRYGSSIRKAIAGAVNYYRCPIGFRPGIAKVLLTRDNIEKIKHRVTHTLQFSKYGEVTSTIGEMPPAEMPPEEFPTGTVTAPSIGPLYWLSERRLTGGAAGEKGSVYVVTLADKRILADTWSDSGTLSANPLKAAHDMASLPYLGATKTWNQLVASLWPSMYGVAPTLPYTPAGFPDNIVHFGESAWRALEDLLDVLQCWLVYDCHNDNFRIDQWGAAQTPPGDLPSPLFDGDPIDVSRLGAPHQIAAYFPDWRQNFGTERDTPLTSNWLQLPPVDRQTGTLEATAEFNPLEVPAAEFPVSVSSATTIGGTCHPLWPPIHRIFGRTENDQNSAHRAAYVSHATQAYADENAITSEHRRYAGIQIFPPGAKYKVCQWGVYDGVVCTEYVAHTGPPRCDDDKPLAIPTAPYRTTDLAAKTYPNWPRETHVVRVFDSGTPIGDPVLPNGDGLYSGYVNGWESGALSQWHTCHIKALDEAASISNGAYAIGRLYGTALSGGQTRPLYLARYGGGETTPPPAQADMYVGYVTTSITPYDPDTKTPGTGVVTVYKRNTTTGVLELQAVEQTVYNLGLNRYDELTSGCAAVEIFRDYFGAWWVCPEVVQFATGTAGEDFDGDSVTVSLTGTVTQYTGQPVATAKLPGSVNNILHLSGSSGDTLLCMRIQSGGTWILVNVKPSLAVPRYGVALVDDPGGVNPGTTTFAITGYERYQGATASPTVAVNTFGVAAAYQEPVFLVEDLYSAAAPQWIAITALHKTQTVLTAWRYFNLNLQYKTRDIVVMLNSDETDWITQATATEDCP